MYRLVITHSQNASPSLGKPEKAAQRRMQLSWDEKGEKKAVRRERGNLLPWVVPLLHTCV